MGKVMTDLGRVSGWGPRILKSSRPPPVRYRAIFSEVVLQSGHSRFQYSNKNNYGKPLG